MASNIVTINVSQTLAPAPSTLQGTGALVSVGGTTEDAGSLTLLTSAADFTSIKKAPIVVSTMTWATNVVTANLAAAHGIPTGKQVYVTIAGVTPSGYNGTYLATATDADSFTYAKTGDPGSVTVQGTAILASVAELQAMVTTYFAQPGAKPVYVLELGVLATDDAIADLADYLVANPETIYTYLLPRAFDTADMVDVANLYTGTTAKVYFFVTTTTGGYSIWADVKSVFAMVEAPSIPATEFDAAAVMAVVLRYAPSSTNRVPQLAFSYLYGVTAYPVAGNSALLTTLTAAGVNYVGTGAEGGLSTKVLFWGTVMDLKPFNYWYSADWAQINLDLALANEAINGSNNPTNPLYYNQDGINRLQNRSQGVMTQGVSYGLALGEIVLTQLTTLEFTNRFNAGEYEGQLVINAEPFADYTTANPSDYSIGRYGGLAAVYTPQNGFRSIIFNLNVTNVV